MNDDTPYDASALLAPVAVLYAHRLKQFGASPRGVFWRHQFGQFLRFDILIGIVDENERQGGLIFNDLGCGYGAFFDFLKDRPEMRDSRFVGYDISAEMIARAKKGIGDPRAAFLESQIAVYEADYSFASGTYNMKLDTDNETWNHYVKESLRHLWTRSRRGLAFNMLDIGGYQEDSGLYFANPKDFVDFCENELSTNVTLVDNHPLKEWTIYVRR